MFGIMNMTNDGTTYSQRDIIFVYFPFSDFTKIKKRPAIVLSNSRFNMQHKDVLCCALSSNIAECEPAVKVTNDDLEFGTLHYPSVIKLAKLFSLEKTQILYKIGRLNMNKSKETVADLYSFISIVE
ncbi:type II toxin-antitoxin system PemK/MazF family toxin [Candidatus Woesearchaeota archaeon]|nr:MAG: type II toxin-antitoxin system PemK/MazF family toxin [Candidatus Woesearchaeota archaeon]